MPSTLLRFCHSPTSSSYLYWPINLPTCMSLGCGRKLEYPKKTHHHRENMQSLALEVRKFINFHRLHHNILTSLHPNACYSTSIKAGISPIHNQKEGKQIYSYTGDLLFLPPIWKIHFYLANLKIWQPFSWVAWCHNSMVIDSNSFSSEWKPKKDTLTNYVNSLSMEQEHL